MAAVQKIVKMMLYSSSPYYIEGSLCIMYNVEHPCLHKEYKNESVWGKCQNHRISVPIAPPCERTLQGRTILLQNRLADEDGWC